MKVTTTPARFDWSLVAGDTETLVVVLPGMDATDRTYTAQVKRSRERAGDPLEEVAVDVALDGEDTHVTCALTSTQTRALEGLSSLVWDLQEVAGDVVTTLMGGSVFVASDVTR